MTYSKRTDFIINMYDTFSTDYDRFVNWESRLAYEIPFIESHLQSLTAGTGRPVPVLDAACGTGQHAIALAQHGFLATGADLSVPMVVRAQQNATAAGVEIPFQVAGFGDLAASFQSSPFFPFDALLCLGNSLPHVVTPEDLATALADFGTCLRPGGLLLIQNRNFDLVMKGRERWMEPQSHREMGQNGEREWLFLRFYDFEPDGLIRFNILTLMREAGSPWQQSIVSTALRPLLYAELEAALRATGFGSIRAYGNLSGAPFDPDTSGNLVITAENNP